MHVQRLVLTSIARSMMCRRASQPVNRGMLAPTCIACRRTLARVVTKSVTTAMRRCTRWPSRCRRAAVAAVRWQSSEHRRARPLLRQTSICFSAAIRLTTHSGSHQCLASPPCVMRRRCRAARAGCGAVTPSADPLEECLGCCLCAADVAGQNQGRAPPGGRSKPPVRYALVRTQTDVGRCGARRSPVDWRRAAPMPTDGLGFMRTCATILTVRGYPARLVRLARQTCRMVRSVTDRQDPRRDLVNPPSRH